MRVLVVGLWLGLAAASVACRSDQRPPDHERGARPPASRGEAKPHANVERTGHADDALRRAVDRSAFLLVDPSSGQTIASQRVERIDEAVWPGSVAKVVTLAAALEAGVADQTTRVRCRRTLHLPPHDLTCAHPDLMRPLTPVDALAHSCNVFFATMAERVPRPALGRAAVMFGVPPVGGDADMRAVALGLAGERVTPRALLTMLQRVVVGPAPAVRSATRALLLEGLWHAAEAGTASALADRGLRGWAKTGTATGAQGGVEGLAVVITADDARRPRHGLVVRAPGAAGRDAAAIAAEILSSRVERSDRRPGGDVRVGRSRGRAAGTIETLALDDYVAGVVAGEAAPDAPASALEALAITARTFALADRGRHEAEGFDVCDLTHCQVVRPATAAAVAASSRTSGRVLVEDERTASDGRGRPRPAAVFYSASCGGTLLSPDELWPAEEEIADGEIGSRVRTDISGTDSRSRVLRVGADPAAHPPESWRTDVTARDLERALATAGVGGGLRDLHVLARTEGGAVARVALAGMAPRDMAAERFRRVVGHALGWQVLKSSWYDITRTSTGYRFDGRGRGHGVGLCLLGASTLAKDGYSAARILQTYFPGLVSAALEEVEGPARRGPERPDAVVSREVRILLPAFDERARRRVSALVEETLVELEPRIGASRPAIVLRVHPTIESFQRATGLAWWTAGATRAGHAREEGTAVDASAVEIHLAPLDVLERRGMLVPTLRHELVHALTLEALAGRPLWVHEGIASHFAAQEPAANIESGPLSCPTDAELRRAGSHRALVDARAAAAACVTRALDAGTPWRRVGAAR